MDIAQESYDVGVIVGRFQVPKLHSAHRELIETVCSYHSKVIILLGLAAVPVARNDPLDFEARKQMILEDYPDVLVLPVVDRPTDKEWSQIVDETVANVATSQSVVLYGSRDSFLRHYRGKYTSRRLESPAALLSGTTIREDVARSKTRCSDDFRAGVIWAVLNRYPSCELTVDVAVLNEIRNQVLLCKKPGEPMWRLIGGFADPTSLSLEHDARREVSEETGLSITDPKIISNFLIDDRRYPGLDKIKTVLFAAVKQFGHEEAKDDIEQVGWFYLDRLFRRIDIDVMPNHRPLILHLMHTLETGGF